ncbi:ABC transporter substrate-binding protein [Paraburkholderia sp.]|uniref:ABC transporter substrate-binding protein n=1 Tax=Paraburkholderia sp. TaxID=1926495 RepID=UPI00239B0FA6|nr:ABC transporter substrate-binding protein [Paraburkholderia sp.]MDE1180019.1 ABC transporter substrate-binding protein [Paraburkholderia sp.]
MTSRRNFIQMLSGSLAGLAVPGVAGSGGLSALGAVSAVGALGVSGAAEAAGAPLTIAFPTDVPSWDPLVRVAPNPISIYRSVFDAPIDIDEKGVLRPGVVTAWRWKDTDGKVLELDLRSDVLFHNGDKLTSDDFKFTFFDRLQADKSLQVGGIWWALVGIDTPSPTRVVMHFKAPMVTAPAFLGYMGGYLLPRKYFEQVGSAGFIAKPIGSGPYRLVDYQRDSRITLSAFDRHWRGQAKVRDVVFQVVKDPTSRVSAVQAGQADVSGMLPLRETVRLGQSGGLGSKITPTIDSYLIHMVNDGPTKDRNVRLAMHHAIDKQALTRAFFNSVPAPMATPAAPGTPAFDPDFKFAYDPAQAQQLLAASGYSKDKPVRVKFLATNGVYPSDYDMARAIVQMWKKVGIEAELTPIETAQFFTQAVAGTLPGPTLWMWQNGSGDPELSAGSYLNPKTGFSVWRSPDVSPRLDPLLVQLDETKRIAGYKEFHRWAVGEGYAVPLMQGIATAAYRKNIGYTPFSSGWMLPDYWSV